jgi:hypothetical protein
MATLQSFDSEIEKTRKIVSEMRGKIEQSGAVLDTLARATARLRLRISTSKTRGSKMSSTSRR